MSDTNNNEAIPYEEYTKYYMERMEHPELYDKREPIFKIGDIVESFTRKYKLDDDDLYFVKEATLVYDGIHPSKYVYEIENTQCSQRTFKIEESDLVYNYHDPKWAAYVESTMSEDEYYCEMATVKGGFMSIKIAIYGSEGKYPHFHFYKGIAPEQGISKEKRSTGGCICIDSANYFMHVNHTDTMDRKEINGLIKFLKSPHKLLKEYSNWQYIISEWDQNNPDQKQLPIDLPIPDYKHDMNTIQEI